MAYVAVCGWLNTNVAVDATCQYLFVATQPYVEIEAGELVKAKGLYVRFVEPVADFVGRELYEVVVP